MSDQPPIDPRARNNHRTVRPPLAGIARTPADERTRVDLEQTLADSDQTLEDSDQTSSDSDQTSADYDQIAADEDQAASDRDLAHGGEPAVHEHSRDVRLRTTRQRAENAQTRLGAAARRDENALARDLAARARDEAAAARDAAMAQFDDNHDLDSPARAITGAEIVMRAAEQRRRAAKHRARAAEHRALAAEDRLAAADDRAEGAHDRLHARADREALAHQLELAETDAVTGARTRGAGLRDLDRELERCRRTDGLMVVAYVDVVGLKALNDSAGHEAGDALLKSAVTAIRTHLRPYDLVVRLGGDEFLCAMPHMTGPDARRRFREISLALASTGGATAIRTGFAELAPDETAGDLIARADRELIEARR